MRRIISSLLIIALIFTLLSGCKFGKSEPFALDNNWSEGSVDFYLKNADAEMIACGNPFYRGEVSLPAPGVQEYETLRAEKVSEIMTESAKLVGMLDATDEDFETLRLALLAYLDVVRKESKKDAIFVRDAFLKISKLKTARTLAKAQYDTFATAESENKFAKAYMDFCAYNEAVEYMSFVLKEMECILTYSALGVLHFEKSENQNIKNAGAQLETVLKGSPLNQKLSEINDQAGHLSYLFKQMETADYYFSIAVTEYISEKLPELREQAKTIEIDSEYGLDPQFVDTYLTVFENFNNQTKKQLEGIDKKTLLEVRHEPKVFTAFATDIQSGTYQISLNESYASLKMKEEKQAKEEEKGFFAKGWEAAKTAVNGVRTTIGVGVDLAGAAVKTVGAVGYGVYYGNSVSDMAQHSADGFKEVVRNFNNNMSGAQTFKTATDYFDHVEKSSGQYVEVLVSEKSNSTYGWVAGGATSLVVGMFTGLGKGISKVANRQATAGETAEGVIDIGFSFIGGSKILINGGTAKLAGQAGGKTAVALLKGGSTLMTEKAIGFATGNLSKKNLVVLTNALSKSGLETAQMFQTFTNAARVQALNTLKETLAKNRQKIIDALLADLKKKGLEGLKTAKMTLQQELTEKIKVTYTKNISGIAQALRDTVGKDAASAMENLVGEWIDNQIIDIVGSYINDLVEAVTMKDLIGSYSGKLAVTDIKIDEAAMQAEAEKEGCEFNAAEARKELQNQKVPINATISMTDDYTGVMVLTGKDADPIRIPFTFSDNLIKGESGAQDNSYITISLTPTKIGNSVSLSGKIEIELVKDKFIIYTNATFQK